MYQFTANRGVHRCLVVGMAVLLVGLFSVPALGQTRPILQDIGPGGDLSTLDPDAGSAATIFASAPLLFGEDGLPEGVSEGTSDLRTVCPCVTVAEYLTENEEENGFRGNVYTIDPDGPDRVLCKFKMPLRVPGVDTTLCFYVYKCVSDCTYTTGQYERIWSDTRRVGGSDEVVVYSSPDIEEIVLEAGGRYAIGVAWYVTDPADIIKFGRDNRNYPVPQPEFGIIAGRFGQNYADKPCSEIAESLSVTTISGGSRGAYEQRICLEPPTGACCLGTTCVELTKADCAAQDGQFTFEKSLCEGVVCPLPVGACCFGEACTLYPEMVCDHLGGLYLGMVNSSGIWMMADSNADGIVDSEDFAEFQTCLSYGNGPLDFPDEKTCVDVCGCDSNGLLCNTTGLYAPLGNECLDECFCDSNGIVCTNGEPAFHPVQYCLDSFDFDTNGTIDLLDFADFQVVYGQGQCSGDPCRYTRAPCCLYDGTCEENLTEDECEAFLDALWQPDAPMCTAELCTPLGSCCMDETCFDGWAEYECQGDWCRGYHCFAGLCPLEDGICPDMSTTGACCEYDGTCHKVSEYECNATDGEYYGNGTACADIPPCPVYGACCAGNYCLELLEEDCPVDGFTFTWQNGVRCTPSPCAGACCDLNDNCQVLTKNDCDAVWGDYAGNGTVCEFDLCPLTGACCFPGGGCADDMSSDECADTVVGCWAGAGMECAVIECGDLNTNGVPDACEP